jgi:hypothetical protein
VGSITTSGTIDSNDLAALRGRPAGRHSCDVGVFVATLRQNTYMDAQSNPQQVRRRCTFSIPAVVTAALIVACNSPASPDVPSDAMRVAGTVQYFSLEGGFWAVRGDDGRVYDPMNGLPPAFQRENLRVLMVVKVRTDVGGIHMIGPIVEILRIVRA